jgi:hypothetical protein
LNTISAADELSSVEMSTFNESIPEIPGFELTAGMATDAEAKGSQTPVASTDVKVSTEPVGTVAQAINPEMLATPEPAIMSTDPLVAGGKSGVPATQEPGSQNLSIDTGLERLEGIRSAIAELDAHVTVRAQAADPANPVNSTNELKAKLAELEMTYRVSREVLQGKSQQSQQPTTTPVSDQNLVQKDARPNVDKMGMETEEQLAESIGKSARPVRERVSNALTSGIHRPGGTGEGSGAGLETGGQISANSPTAAFTGIENSEISADMDRNIESLEFDAANIEAVEVPELPVQDMSQIDVDFEDPSGHVRLGMAREGQEVFVQLETPEDALQDYKDMEEEMAEQLAGQGLDLASFTADSNSDADGEESGSNSTSEESRQGASSDADKGEALEQDGTSARLVNRIV